MDAAQAMKQQNQDAAIRARRNADAELESYNQTADMAQRMKEAAEQAAEVAQQWQTAAEGAAIRYQNAYSAQLEWEGICK
ncbi:MAG TPA: hypothetical protein VIU93_02560 [Gallionellaceae bacterium]